eukprot:gene17863-biopygen8456
MNDDVHLEWEQIVNVLQTAGEDVLGLCKPRISTWQEEFAPRLHAMAQERRDLASTHADDSVQLKTRLREVRAAHQRETRGFVREVRQAIRELKKKKAAGEDRIVAEMLQLGGTSLHERMSRFVKLVWKHGSVPKAWRDAVVVPLLKGGDLRLCDNWRGISPLSVPGKILALIIVKRLTPVAESLLGETANGFRPERGCEDVVAFVRDLLEQVNVSKIDASLHMIFADLKKCFDSLSRIGIWAVLRRFGIPPKLLAVIRSFHDGMEARVRCNGGLSDPFAVRRGVRQGCVLAPTLMLLFYAAVMADWRAQ